MSGLEIVGGVSAIVSLAHFAKKLGLAAHGFFGCLKEFDNGIQNIENELYTISIVLEQLDLAFRTPPKTGLFSLQGQ